MTFEQKRMLCMAMRSIGLAKEAMTRFSFMEACKYMDNGHDWLQKLANEVKMNGE